MNDSLQKLKQATAESSIAHVAKRIGVERCTLSLVVNDKYPASPKKILDRFDAVYGGVHCPHLKTDLSRSQCHDFNRRSRPSNPLGLMHWRACQNCEHKEG